MALLRHSTQGPSKPWLADFQQVVKVLSTALFAVARNARKYFTIFVDAENLFRYVCATDTTGSVEQSSTNVPTRWVHVVCFVGKYRTRSAVIGDIGRLCRGAYD